MCKCFMILYQRTLARDNETEIKNGHLWISMGITTSFRIINSRFFIFIAAIAGHKSVIHHIQIFDLIESTQ